jgi:signal transduction histidine kinase
MRPLRDRAADFVHETRASQKLALALASLFAVFGILWVLTTDVLLYGAERDPLFSARVHLVADWVFLVVTATLLFVFARHAATQLSRAHAVVSAVVRSVGDGLLVLGRDRTIIYANPAAVRMLECNDASQLIGMNATEFSRNYLVSYPNGALVKPEAFVSQRAFTHPGTLRYKAVLHPSPDDELVIISTAAGVHDEDQDHASLVVSTMHDVTSEEHLERMRDHFFSAAAHALKTPIAIIKANVQLMVRTMQPLPSSEHAVERQCDRIDRLVQNLLIVSRQRTHSLQLFPQELDLVPLIERAGEELMEVRAAAAVTTEIADCPAVRGDRERLQLVIRNLAYQALFAARPHTPLALRLSPLDGYAEVSVLYEPLPVAERTYAGAEDYDDTQLARCANATIVDAHGGIAGEEATTDDHANMWIRLPMSQQRAA